ncbi:MAG TPA: DUF1572 family protein [Terriglobia bacterium]|nr:DUF1572 family protein [Terriglobia bacterium]
METRPARRNTAQQKSGSALNAQAGFTQQFLREAERLLEKHYLPRISSCLNHLDEQDIWWRPNPASNSAGNLTLHLAGNVRQWIVCGLGGKPDFRDRNREFQEQGPVPARLLLATLRKSVQEGCAVLGALGPDELGTLYAIQKFQVTGFQAVSHVVDHFAYHSGQIVFITKLKLGQDLNFTRLPGATSQSRKGPRFPAI